MPYVPAIRVSDHRELFFISGATALPLYHEHPHLPEEERLPDDIGEQTRRVLANHQTVLEHEGLTFRDVVKANMYMTDPRDVPGASKVMSEFFGDWIPTSTMLFINALSAPGARIEIEMVAAR